MRHEHPHRHRIEKVTTPEAPSPVGPYSQGIKAGRLIFVSGQIPLDPRTGKMVEGDFKKRAERALLNALAIVEAAGGSLDSVVKVTVYLRDINRFPEFNEVYEKVMQGRRPTRAVVGVSGLPAGADIEVEMIAFLED